jgi:hypothetical protein
VPRIICAAFAQLLKKINWTRGRFLPQAGALEASPQIGLSGTRATGGFHQIHILLGLLAILGGAAFWYWRLKAVKEATDDVADMAGRAWGKWQR